MEIWHSNTIEARLNLGYNLYRASLQKRFMKFTDRREVYVVAFTD